MKPKGAGLGLTRAKGCSSPDLYPTRFWCGRKGGGDRLLPLLSRWFLLLLPDRKPNLSPLLRFSGLLRSCFGAPGTLRLSCSRPAAPGVARLARRGKVPQLQASQRRHGGASARSLRGTRGGEEAAARRLLKGGRKEEGARSGGRVGEGGEPASQPAGGARRPAAPLPAMEDGVKQASPEKPKCASTADKVGWLKKSSGGILGLWKERYILLCKTQLLMYEDEDEQKGVETVELENYEKCQDLRALLNRKHRFILIRSPGYKVHDIKFQACHKEEKESWMKALNEGISRGKNRVFDEVKVDESLSLEHVTRGRAKVGQSRRPPTRSHLKEVANAMSDGILRLDLDVPDSGPPDTTLVTSDHVKESPPNEKVKPPLPPAKPPAKEQNPDSVSGDLEAKKPLMPPAKNLKDMEAPSDNQGDGCIQVENTEESKVGPEAENLMEVIEHTPRVPVLPKALSVKVKVTWDEPAAEQPDVNDGSPPAAGSQENLHEDAKEVAKPPAPPPKILSEMLRASMDSQRGSSAADVSECDQKHDDPTPPVNGINGEGITGLPPEEPDLEPGEEQRANSLAQEVNEESSSLPALLESVGSSSPLVPRSSSVGDLLMEPKKKLFPGQDLQRGAALLITQMEKKVACERERTERLLQQVLNEPPGEGNGPPTNRETLLSKAVEELRQATQVLQETRELKKEHGEKHKEVHKDLVTLYRRSAP